jgi:quercetin dioxygenase-like cupin family protein
MKRKIISVLILYALCLILSSSVYSQDKMIYTPNDIVWNDAPPPFPAGTKITVLEGDPSKDGFFTIRVKLLAGFKIPPHWHPATEHVTVVSGVFNLGFGDKFDQSKGTAMPAGSIAIMPAKHHHYAWANEETIIQLHGVGPWQLYYVNPEDDPAHMK